MFGDVILVNGKPWPAMPVEHTRRPAQPPAGHNEEFVNTNVIMAFDVTSDATDTTNNDVPPVLNPDNEPMQLQPAQAKANRLLEFKREGGEWTVNGRTWADVENSGFTKVEGHPGLNDVEIWTLKNNSGGWFHPVHIHLVDFKILDRNGRPRCPTSGVPRTSRTSARARRSASSRSSGPRSGGT